MLECKSRKLPSIHHSKLHYNTSDKPAGIAPFINILASHPLFNHISPSQFEPSVNSIIVFKPKHDHKFHSNVTSNSNSNVDNHITETHPRWITKNYLQQLLVFILIFFVFFIFKTMEIFFYQDHVVWIWKLYLVHLWWSFSFGSDLR